MKTRILVATTILLLSFAIPQVFGICMGNPDWPDAPCYAMRGEGTNLEEVRQDWAPYYDFKGSKWMDLKKQEMMQAIQNGTLFEWIQLTEYTREHENVHRYYFLFGEVPNTDGEFVDEYYADSLDTHIVKVDYTTPTFFAILGIVPATLIGIAILWMKRK